MDFLDPKKRRQHKIRLIIGYCLVGIAIAIITYLLLLQTYGFGFDPKTGQVIQNGLVYVSTHPTSADVYVNNEHKGESSLKLTIPSGNYDFVLKSRGYRNWHSTVSLPGGGVVDLTYPLLIPEKLTAADVRQYDKSPSFITSSPDRRWLIVLQPDSATKFDVYDLRQSIPTPTTITLPASLLKQASGPKSYKPIEWSDDNRHVLLEHIYKGGKEFIVLDRQEPDESFNVNSLLSATPSSVVLQDKRFDRLYAYIPKTKSLLNINADNEQVDTVLKDVLSFKAYSDDTILYVSDVSKVPNQYSVNIWDGQDSYLLQNYPAKTAYRLDMASYNNLTYVAVAPVSTDKLYVYKNPLNLMRAGTVPNPFIALKINDPQFVSFSNNAQFVTAQSGSSFANYDFDTNSWRYFKFKDKLPLTSKATWMDGHRMLLNIDSKINVFDFDGGNKQSLIASLADTAGFFDSRYAQLYTLAASIKEPTKAALVRVSMVVR